MQKCDLWPVFKKKKKTVQDNKNYFEGGHSLYGALSQPGLNAIKPTCYLRQ